MNPLEGMMEMISDLSKLSRKQRELLIGDLEAVKRQQIVEKARAERRRAELAREIAALNDEIAKSERRIDDANQSIDYLSF